MPRDLFRLLAVVILAISVPVQGMAAVTAGVCMAVGHHDDGAAHDSHAHEHDGAAAHEHGKSDDHQGTAAAHCPPCVSCCAAAAMTSFPPLSLPERPAALAVATLPPLVSGVTLETFDRPPLAL